MKHMFFLLLLCCFHAGAQDYGYYVTTKGDTVKLGKKDYIDVHSHPQLLRVRDANGKKRVITPDQVVFLEQKTYTRRDTMVFRFTLLDIPTKNRPCRHYVRSIYQGKTAAIMETPYCTQYHNQELYLVQDGRFISMLTSKNLLQLVEQYLPEHTALLEYARTQKYRSHKVHRLLTGSKRNAMAVY